MTDMQNLYRVTIAINTPRQWVVKTFIVEAEDGPAAVDKLFQDWVGADNRAKWTVENVEAVYTAQLTDGIWFVNSQ